MIPFEKLIEGSILDRFIKELNRLKINSEYLVDLAKRSHIASKDKTNTVDTNV